jgi:hypothetical protein
VCGFARVAVSVVLVPVPVVNSWVLKGRSECFALECLLIQVAAAEVHVGSSSLRDESWLA